MPKLHLDLQVLELIGDAGLGFGAHLFVGPLLDAVEFLVDVHGGGCLCELVVRGTVFDVEK